MQGWEFLLRVGVRLFRGGLRRTSSQFVLAARFATLALAGTLSLPFGAAHAQDATWLSNPTDDNFNNGANWSTGTVPTGTATFGSSSITTFELTAPGLTTSVGGWTFNAGASNYTFYNLATFQQLVFTGAGIVINGGSILLETSNGGGIEFQNGSSAASASILNVLSSVNFSGTSTAADATIFNQNTFLRFSDNASAGNASIAVTDRSAVQFFGNSTAGNATITITGPTFIAGTSSVNFTDNSTAGNSTITGDGRSEINFTGDATAGNATITNNNLLTFSDTSDAGAASATITNNSQIVFNGNSDAGFGAIVNNGRITFNDSSRGAGAHIANNGRIEFTGNSNGLAATITNSADAVVDLSGSTGFFGDGKLSVGSLIGGGNVYLGSNTVTIANGNGTFGGVISDCGAGGTACANSGASGGALVKSGSGFMTLTNANTYTGGTTVSSGILQLGDATHTGSIIGGVTVSGGTFNLFNTDLSAITTIDNSGFTFFNNNTTASTAAITNNLILYFQDSSSADHASITNTNSVGFRNAATAGNASISNFGNIFFQNNSTGGNAAIVNNAGGTVDFSASTGPNGDHRLSAGSIAGAGNFYLGSNALTVGGNNQSTTVSGAISDCGAGGSACSVSGATGGMLVKAGTGDLTLSGANTYTGGTWVAAGTLSLANNDALGTGAVMLDPGTTLHLAGAQIANAVNIWDISKIAVTGANSLNTIAGSGDINILGTSGSATIDVLTLNGPNAYIAATFIGDGTIGAAATLKGSSADALSAGSTTTVTANSILDLNGFDQAIGALAGAGTVTNGGASAATLTANGNGSSTIFSGVIEDGSSATALTKTGTGTLTLSGISTFTGATTVNGGSLIVDGSIVSSSGVQVNAGATAGGSGFLPSTAIASGGTLALGSSATALTVNGTLTFDAGAAYAVQISPTAAGHTDITGTANLAGTAFVAFAPGNYTRGNYTILSAAGGLGGTRFDTLQTSMPGFVTSLGYTANDAVLTISSAVLGAGQELGRNQQNVANTINGYFNNGGMLPTSFSNLFSLSGNRLNDALSQVSGELGTASQQATSEAMSQFMGLLTDPFMQGNSGAGEPANGASAYADEGKGARPSRKPTDAFAMFDKTPPYAFRPRWSVWSTGFGGSQSTHGNAVVGSNDTTSHLAGAAVGANYLFAPRTLAGFALAGGGTSFSVNGLGSGRSDLFQAGAYLRHADGPAYVSTALAYGWQDIKTDRYVTVSGIEHLQAKFNVNAYSGRIEGGYRFAMPAMGGMGITPYAAGQFTTFDSPAYAERTLSGTGAFALAYGSRRVTDGRSELGFRTDRSFAMAGGVLTLRGRFAWAHDYNPDRAIAATFQALPGAGFTVNGAAQAPDSVLTTASAEVKWFNGWSAAVTFEGTFSDVTSSYAGKGAVRYQW